MKMHADTRGATYNAFRKFLELHITGTTLLALEVSPSHPGTRSRVSDIEAEGVLNKHG
jgi:hypothetical protein